MNRRKVEVTYTGDLAKLQLKEGDILVLTLAQRMSPEVADAIQNQLLKTLGFKVPVIVVDGGGRIDVVSPTEGVRMQQ